MADYVIFRGRRACVCLAAWLPVFERELLRLGVIKERIDIAQLTGGAAASAGTHSQGGAFDIWQTDPTTIKIARQMGADATWHRTPAQGFSHHTHGVLRGCPHNSPARYQIGAVDAGYNGLGYAGRGGRDDGPRPLSKRTWRQGIEWAKARQTVPVVIRPVGFNFPDKTKLPSVPEADRIAAGRELLRLGRPTVIGWNETVGIRGPGKASELMTALDVALGSAWYLVKPTLPYNENYLSWRHDILNHVRQYDDKVLPSASGGRHLTRVVLKHEKSGLVFAVGVTQLVSTRKDASDAERTQNERDRQAQAKDAHRYLQNVSQLHDDCPYILLGDMNTHHDLRALVEAGMKRASRWADKSNDRTAATYTNYAKDRPSTNPDWAVDQTWFSKHWWVNEWDVLRDLTSAGDYRKPRPSDHDATAAEARPA